MRNFPAALRNAISAAVGKELAAYGGSTPIPGAVVGVWVPGKGEFVKAFGYANLAPRVAMATTDHFRIGSNTKTFVATVLLQLVDEKKLALDDTIAHFGLGVTVPNANTITVRELAEMRSGIIDMYAVPGVQKEKESVWASRSPKQWVNFAGTQPPLFAPGTKYNYSNTNWFILGLIIENVTHDTVAHQIESRHSCADAIDADIVSDDRSQHAGAVRARLSTRATRRRGWMNRPCSRPRSRGRPAR